MCVGVAQSSHIALFFIVLVDKYSVLRGVAGEGEGERGEQIKMAFKHLPFPGI